MILLFDIGNTHTHLGLANRRRVVKQRQYSHRSLVRRAARRNWF